MAFAQNSTAIQKRHLGMSVPGVINFNGTHCDYICAYVIVHLLDWVKNVAFTRSKVVSKINFERNCACREGQSTREPGVFENIGDTGVIWGIQEPVGKDCC